MKQDLHKLSQQQMQETLENYQKELSKLRMQQSSGAKLDNPGNVKKIRRNIARIYTLQNHQNKSAQPQHIKKTTAEKQGGARNKT